MSSSEIDELIDLMARLPGLGPRSARRAVLHLIRKRALLLTPLADAMQQVAATARECLNCGNVGTTEICDICASEKRATGVLCVVEDVSDLWAMERAGAFKGRYHVLGVGHFRHWKVLATKTSRSRASWTGWPANRSPKSSWR